MNPMSSAWSLRRFLLQQPRAHRIRVVHEGGTEELTPARKSWTKTAETLHALQPESIQLLDVEGRVIRAMRTDESDSVSDRAPDPPAVIAADPETARMTHFANLLARAYEHSTEVAFAKLVEIVERMGDRSDSIESRLERTEAANRRLWQSQLEDAMERAAESAGVVENGGGEANDAQQAMMAAFIQGMLSKGMPQATPPKATNGTNGTNGKG